MLRIAVPNKGSLADASIEILKEAGYRQRTDSRDLVLIDPANGVEFYYTIPGNTKCKVNGVTLIEGYGLAKCGDITNQIKMEGTQGYLSTVAFKELTKACEAYASTGNKEDSNYA